MVQLPGVKSQHHRHIAGRIVLAGLVAAIGIGTGILRARLVASSIGGRDQADLVLWTWGIGLLVLIASGTLLSLTLEARARKWRNHRSDVVFLFRKTPDVRTIVENSRRTLSYFAVVVADISRLRICTSDECIVDVDWAVVGPIEVGLASFQGSTFASLNLTLPLSQGDSVELRLLVNESPWGVIFPMGDQKVERLAVRLEELRQLSTSPAGRD